MNEWQSLETAPRDTLILVAWKSKTKWMITPARWRQSRVINQPLWGWHVEELTDLTFELCIQPTHWMPLPEPPTKPVIEDAST